MAAVGVVQIDFWVKPVVFAVADILHLHQRKYSYGALHVPEMVVFGCRLCVY